MLEDQNDDGLASEAKTVRVGQLPCIKRIIEEGASGKDLPKVMREVAKDCYNRLQIDRNAAINVLLECNKRNKPPLSDRDIFGIASSVYTSCVEAIPCGEKFLKDYCDQQACRKNGSPVAKVPPPIKVIAPSPVAVIPAPVSNIFVTAPSILTDDFIADTSFKSDRRFITIDCLPDGWNKEYIRLAYPLTEAPFEFHLATSFAIAGTALGRNVFLREGSSIYFANLYQIILAESALYRKSTALNLCKEFLPAINEDFIMGEMLSLEGFIDGFRTCPTRLIIYDELMKLTVSESKSYGKGLMTEFTTLWECPPELKIGLKNLKPEERSIKNPTLSILAATTPAWLNIKEKDILGGFWGRFIPILADDSNRRSLPIRPPMDQAQKDQLLQRLKVISGMSVEYTWQEDARKYFIEIYRNINDALEKEPNKELFGSFWGRINVHIKKLSMIFDACSPSPTFTITKDNVVRAKTIMEHATFCYREMLKCASLGEIDKAERKIYEMLAKAYPEWLQHSKIMRDGGNIKASILNKVMSNLDAKEQIDIKTEPSARKPRNLYRLRKR